MPQITLITGATSGIGLACANRLAKEGHWLIINGRRIERLQELKNRLVQEHQVQVLALPFDVRNVKTVEKTFDDLKAPWTEIDNLINNAGLALGFDPIDNGLLADWEQMIDTNIKGLLYVSRAVIPFMKARKSGHIINIGSVAGREIYPKGNVYCATKHSVDALSQAMRIDLLEHGIKVTQISPGAVETEFSQVRFHGDLDKASKVYQGFKPLTGADVAEVVAFALSLPKHVNINDMLLMPTAQATASLINRNLNQ
ncbi:MAG TPA: SDR family NAD(P)-dependent oxidoreductase [Bacteroidales bacterium]|nr:SDR family NAD(P)-dependent oxidoreductase [Bacteroidales bacterium]